MAALERYDDWESTVDARLGADPIVQPEPPSIEDLYDEDTMRAIDRQSATARRGGWRGGLAAGAVAAGLLGTAAALDDDDEDDAVVELERARAASRLEPVSVYLAWGNPAASVAIVRPWLL